MRARRAHYRRVADERVHSSGKQEERFSSASQSRHSSFWQPAWSQGALKPHSKSYRTQVRFPSHVPTISVTPSRWRSSWLHSSPSPPLSGEPQAKVAAQTDSASRPRASPRRYRAVPVGWVSESKRTESELRISSCLPEPGEVRQLDLQPACTIYRPATGLLPRLQKASEQTKRSCRPWISISRSLWTPLLLCRPSMFWVMRPCPG